MTIVVTVPMTPPKSIRGTLPSENFAPLSPWRCRLRFSSSLRSLVSICVVRCFIDFKNQDPHILVAATYASVDAVDIGIDGTIHDVTFLIP